MFINIFVTVNLSSHYRGAVFFAGIPLPTMNPLLKVYRYFSMVRGIPNPELHSRAVVAAARLGLSLNKYIEKAIEDETKQVLAQ